MIQIFASSFLCTSSSCSSLTYLAFSFSFFDPTTSYERKDRDIPHTFTNSACFNLPSSSSLTSLAWSSLNSVFKSLTAASSGRIFSLQGPWGSVSSDVCKHSVVLLQRMFGQNGRLCWREIFSEVTDGVLPSEFHVHKCTASICSVCALSYVCVTSIIPFPSRTKSRL